jgi:hypothetical protein
MTGDRLMKKQITVLTALLIALVRPGIGEHGPAALPEPARSASTEEPEWTWQNPLPQGNTLNAVWGSGSDDVFAVGDAGTILHYEGGDWKLMMSGTTVTLKDVWGSSSSSVFAIGEAGTVLYYDGDEWSAMSSGTLSDLNAVWGSSASNVFAVGSSGTIRRYDGVTWHAMNSRTTESLNGLWGSSGTSVLAVGDSGTIRHYNGTAWYAMTSNTSWNLNAVWGNNASSVYAVGNTETILHYNGVAWNVVTSGPSHGAYTGVWGSSSNNVYILSNFCDIFACGGTIRNLNGSEVSQPIAGAGLLFGIWGGSADNLFAVGAAGVVLHHDGATWATNPGIRTTLHGIWGSSGHDVWALGPSFWRDTTTLHYDGSLWHATEYRMRIFDVWGTTASDIFAVGDTTVRCGRQARLTGSTASNVLAMHGYQPGVIMYYDGHEWSEMDIPSTIDPSGPLNGVWGSSGTSVFAVGGGGTILHYNGNRWSAMTSGTSRELRGVWGTDDNHVVVVGNYGTVLRHDGNAWHEMRSGTTMNLKGVWGTGPEDVFAVGGSYWDEAGIILHYDGNVWREVYRVPEYELDGIWGSGPDRVFVVGEGGAILHYDGTSWDTMTSGTSNWLHAVWGSDPNDVFAVGERGTILHYAGGLEEGTISGKVTSTTEDPGLPGVTVTARTYSTTTDLHGNYTLSVPPGVYTVKATPSASMDYYANRRSFITVRDGEAVTVDLKLTSITADTVDTLILANLQRMKDIGYSVTAVDELASRLGELTSSHPERTNMTATLVDLGANVSPEIDAACEAWDGNEGNVTKTNDLVNAIDAHIENLKRDDYPNLEYLIIVGSHEVIPMKARAADNHEENEWATTLPRDSGYLYEIYHSTKDGAKGYYLTDSQYGDLSHVSNRLGLRSDSELVPELAVGRMVETPQQIANSVDTYLASKGTLSLETMASIASVDYMDSGTLAGRYMGPQADTSLVREGFPSGLVPTKIEANDDLVYLGGHGHYNLLATRKDDQAFVAGYSATQGSTGDFTNDLSDAVIVASGCHNGVNFGNQRYHAPDGTTTKWADFPEEFAMRKSGVYLAATGYTWVSISVTDTETARVTMSEQLATDFIRHLLDDNQTTAGHAFKAAVNDYVSGKWWWEKADKRVLAIATLYGIPNYRPSAVAHVAPFRQAQTSSGENDSSFDASKDSLPSATVQRQVAFDIADWNLDSDGIVKITNASYMASVNVPLLPVVALNKLGPPGSDISSVLWQEANSTSLEIPNDVPLPIAGTTNLSVTGVVTETGVFTSTGFYPATPFFTNTITAMGGGTQLGLHVVPVQYDQAAHTTRVWTRLVFDVEYDVASSDDSDGDGLPDYWERAYGLDPSNDSGDNGADADPDGDGLSNGHEYVYSTNPRRADTDGDGSQDWTEVLLGADPNNPFSKPNSVFLPVVIRE